MDSLIRDASLTGGGRISGEKYPLCAQEGRFERDYIVAMNGRLYAVRGWDERQPSSSVECYDPGLKTESWIVRFH